MGDVGGAYRCLCGGARWGESRRVGCIRSRVYGESVGAGGVEGRFFWGGIVLMWVRCELGGE